MVRWFLKKESKCLLLFSHNELCPPFRAAVELDGVHVWEITQSPASTLSFRQRKEEKCVMCRTDTLHFFSRDRASMGKKYAHICSHP